MYTPVPTICNGNRIYNMEKVIFLEVERTDKLGKRETFFLSLFIRKHIKLPKIFLGKSDKQYLVMNYNHSNMVRQVKMIYCIPHKWVRVI